jgi:hypothetical protein
MRAHLQQTIGKAKLGDSERLEDFVARATSLPPAEAPAAAARALAIIEGIPELLDAVSNAALSRGIGLLVQPLLDHAAEYFVNPSDHAPEAAYGVAGLLDDAYLALSLVNLIHENYEPLVPGNVPDQLTFLRGLLGPELVATLDAETGRAVMKLARTVSTLRERSRLDLPFLIPRR